MLRVWCSQVRKGFGSYVEAEVDRHGELVAVHARRTATGEIKVVKPQMVIGYLLEVANSYRCYGYDRDGDVSYVSYCVSVLRCIAFDVSRIPMRSRGGGNECTVKPLDGKTPLASVMDFTHPLRRVMGRVMDAFPLALRTLLYNG